ncbi:hypothetical protein PMZ80_009395 [Knufia obscura]|uniref:CENP-T/Histone H4 histone fold domain-containing protein n=2 Tax=Knufia TaxID=430999 RepID=A0AAN8EHK1_9EURO|nr:hypothetical protein PMZ80_009395 [Knufia obscura]KAK5955854.1 hypothetical protein OHC33_003495 [Knufia fluminis]
MSNKKRALAELRQPQITPSRREPFTPHALHNVQQRTGTRLRSARSVRHVDANSVRPNSARGILRRLAKITAPTTKRRTLTPTSAVQGKENVVPLGDGDVDDDVKKPRLNFDIEESIEQDDSEILVAPTPSALQEDTEEEDEQPTITFLHATDGRSAGEAATRRQSYVSLLPHSDPALLNEHDEEADEDDNSTFLTERGRRAVSEEPTRMSRYSFGSIRMSDFGSELEIRRGSDRQQKLAILEADDDYGGGFDLEDDIQLGGETEDLRHIRQSSPQSLVSAEEVSQHLPPGANDTFQLDIVDDVNDVNAQQRAVSGEQPQLADSIVVVDNEEDEEHGFVEDAQDVPIVPPASASSGRRQTLLESVAATAKARPKKKLKMNQRGNMVPALPSSLIKRIVHDSQEKAGKRKTTLGKDHMKALEQATEWFFEQVGEDLEAYSQHGRRKKRVSEGDALLLMRRQRVLRNPGELHELAKQWLPRDMLNELELPDRP